MRLARYRETDGSIRAAATLPEGCFALRPEFDLFEAARAAANGGPGLAETVGAAVSDEAVDIDALNRTGRLEAPLLPADPAHCLVTGTGLTHRQSADIRDAMSAASGVSDSMAMYRTGEAGGRPSPGEAGAAPEWFFKGTGHALVPSGHNVDIPPYARSTGEEAELAGVYLINDAGWPVRIGYILANDLSDHRLEERNYLYVAQSKLRPCPIGPELLIGALPAAVSGEICITRNGQTIWRRRFETGDAHMTHSLANLEHHHFKHAHLLQPGDLHIHMFGCPVFSYGDGKTLEPGDEAIISAPLFGAPLRTAFVAAPAAACFVEPLSLHASKDTLS